MRGKEGIITQATAATVTARKLSETDTAPSSLGYSLSVRQRHDCKRHSGNIVRNSLKYVSGKYRKELAGDLKEIYHAGTLEGVEATLLHMWEKARNLPDQRNRITETGMDNG